MAEGKEGKKYTLIFFPLSPSLLEQTQLSRSREEGEGGTYSTRISWLRLLSLRRVLSAREINLPAAAARISRLKFNNDSGRNVRRYVHEAQARSKVFHEK